MRVLEGKLVDNGTYGSRGDRIGHDDSYRA